MNSLEVPFDWGNMTDLPHSLIRNEMSPCPSGEQRLEMGDFMVNAIRYKCPTLKGEVHQPQGKAEA